MTAGKVLQNADIRHYYLKSKQDYPIGLHL
jgi:hypothetical protein